MFSRGRWYTEYLRGSPFWNPMVLLLEWARVLTMVRVRTPWDLQRERGTVETDIAPGFERT